MPGYKKLGRTSDQRKAMLRGLVTDLLRNERITTTHMRAKEAGRRAEKMIIPLNITGRAAVSALKPCRVKKTGPPKKNLQRSM